MSKPSLIQVNNLRFLIMDSPKESNLHLYLRECKRYNVKCIARISPPSYSTEEVTSTGINLVELPFDDGASPPQDIINRWLELVHGIFQSIGNDRESPCIAIHCVAGLGRAPVLVAIALLEFSGLDAVAAVTLIREKRRGAINAVQLAYLENYRPSKKFGAAAGSKCTIS